MKPLDILTHNTKIPVIASPMFLVSEVDLVVSCCTAGIVGTFPALNRRTTEEFEAMVVTIKEKINTWEQETGKQAAPFGVNLIVHMTNTRLHADLAICVKHKIPLIITSLGAVHDVVDTVHSYGGIVLHDVIKRRHAEKAIAAGVDGLILVCAGAGGHAGTLHPMPFIKEVRSMFDGIIVLAGSISDGQDIASTLMMGADMAYMGTRFIATQESLASAKYKSMITESKTDDIVYTAAISGVNANFLKPSLEENNIPETMWQQKGVIDFEEELNSEAKAWKSIWSAGHGVASIDDIPTVADLVTNLEKDFRTHVNRLFSEYGRQ